MALVATMSVLSVKSLGISYRLKKSKLVGNKTNMVGGGFVKTALIQLTNGRKSMTFGIISTIKAL